MLSLLDGYLEQVAAHLSALPAKRRADELREIRQHLQNAVTANRERGQSEDEAAQNAVLQFGTPEDVGGRLVWAWRRARMRRLRKAAASAGAGAAGAMLLGSLLCLAGNPTTSEVWCHSTPGHCYFYLVPHSDPLEFRIDHVRGEVGITFGRFGYIH